MTDRPDLNGEPVAVRSLFPEDETYNESPMRQADRQRNRVRTAADGADVLVVSDTDLDGLGAATIVSAAHGGDRVGFVPASHDQQLSIFQTLDLVHGEASHVDRVYICDLPPNTPQKYERAVEKISAESEVVICDHHDTWDADLRDRLDATADVNIGDSISAAEVTYRTVGSLGDAWEEFAALVTDHDVGAEDDDSESTFLADYADAATADEFVAAALDAEGSPADNESVRSAVETHRNKKERLIALAVRRATVVEVAGHRVATTYGRGPASQTWNRIESEYDADVFVFVKPDDKFNVRSRSSVPVARDIANMFWGGGHDCEAGAKPGFYGRTPSADMKLRNGELYPEAIPWAEHWATMGREARRRAVRAVEIAIEDD